MRWPGSSQLVPCCTLECFFPAAPGTCLRLQAPVSVCMFLCAPLPGLQPFSFPSQRPRMMHGVGRCSELPLSSIARRHITLALIFIVGHCCCCNYFYLLYLCSPATTRADPQQYTLLASCPLITSPSPASPCPTCITRSGRMSPLHRPYRRAPTSHPTLSAPVLLAAAVLHLCTAVTHQLPALSQGMPEKWGGTKERKGEMHRCVARWPARQTASQPSRRHETGAWHATPAVAGCCWRCRPRQCSLCSTHGEAAALCRSYQAPSQP